MRIREIAFTNFRSFRGEHRISFVDSETDMVRPVTILAGSNGSGKTTVLEAVEALLSYIYLPIRESNLLNEVLKSGFIHLTLELTAKDIDSAYGTPQFLHIAVGQRELAPDDLERLWPLRAVLLKDSKSSQTLDHVDDLILPIRMHVRDLEVSKTMLQGGLLYFPHDRRLGHTHGGPIEQPDSEQEWLFHFSAEDQWRGSLEQLWVWQNYLDLERRSKHNHTAAGLPQFVESVEKVLGENRRIFIEEGRVRVTTPYLIDGKEISVQIDQLPSGEQQVLLLFGELARRRRQGCVLAIDEIENSLHPTLQRLVMWNLNRIAREWDSQVIVSTHSLEVINTVRGGAFINLDYPEDHFNLPLPEADASQS